MQDTWYLKNHPSNYIVSQLMAVQLQRQVHHINFNEGVCG